MLSIIEQFSAASKSNQQARIAMFTSLSQTAFDSTTKLLELNFGVLKATLAESAAFNQQLLAAKDPQELLNLTVAHVQPVGEKMLSYSHRAAGIASATHAELSKAIQATSAETQQNVLALVDEMCKKAPAGAEPALSLVKSAIGNATAGIELLSKGTQQAFGVLNGQQPSAVKPVSKAA